MGEHIADGVFRIVDATVQRDAGTVSRFVRALTEALSALGDFFSRTKHQYTRFNYLGEWHSHPSYSLDPSLRDSASINEQLLDPKVGARFCLLLIVRDDDGALQARGHLYTLDGRSSVELMREGNDDTGS